MNIEARKIEFIQEFLKLQSEEAISKLEEILKKEKSSHKETEQMSIQELNKRIDKSMKDSENGRLTETKDLLADIEKWS
ncbi:MAG: hypothetical protein ACTIKA_01230 [Psychroflexus halocasei]